MHAAIGYQVPTGREARLPWMRASLFGVALIISLALHGVVLLEFPDLPVGRPTELRRFQPQPLVMQSVRPEAPPPRSVQPAKFRPENPEAFAKVDALQKTLLEDMRTEAEAAEFVAPPPAEAAPPAPAPAENFAEMDFRQEILQIEQRSAVTELAALPRQVVPAVTRIAGAPDITLPATAEAIEQAAAAVAGRGTFAPRPLSVLAAAAPPAEEMMDAASQSDWTPVERLQEQAQMLDEVRADVTDVAPIEQMLAVDVSTYRATDEDALYFEVAITRSGVESLPVLPKDVLLIQDCSESITRTKLDYFKEGIVDYLRTLTTADRINLMRYSDTPTLCFDTWEPVTTDSLAQAVQFTAGLRARGQTDLFAPLQQVLKIPRQKDRPMIAVLMTDGRPTVGTVDSSDIIARFSRANAGQISMFTIGAGDRVNTFLLDLLGHNNRGGSWLMALREQIPAAVKRAARELSRPVLANLDFRFSGDSAAEVYPGTLTHLYLDRPLRLVGRCPANQTNALLQIIGDSGAQKHDMVFGLDLTAARDGGEGIRREWVAQKIYKLMNDHIENRRGDILREIRDLSIRHNVPLPYGADFPL